MCLHKKIYIKNYFNIYFLKKYFENYSTLQSQKLFRLRLFSTCFCVCGETNATRCLITSQTAFCIARLIKKLSLKRSFCEAVFIYFLIKFRKTLFVFAF
jgi:hypothetical protein